MLKKKELKLSKEKNQGGKNQIKTILSTWAAAFFNIFVTLIDYCGGYPRARGVFLMSTPGRGGA